MLPDNRQLNIGISEGAVFGKQVRNCDWLERCSVGVLVESLRSLDDMVGHDI